MSDVKDKARVIVQLPKLTIYSDGKIYIKDVRCSYPHLDKPWAMDPTADPKYSIMGLIPKTADYRESVEALQKYLANFLAEKRLQPIPKNRMFLRDGDDTGKKEMAGHWTVSASERDPPILRGRYLDRTTGKIEIVSPADAAKVYYGGCWVSLMLEAWHQNHQVGGRRLNANLRAVQFLRNDTPFGRGRISDDEVDDVFEAVPDDEGGFEKDAPFDL